MRAAKAVVGIILDYKWSLWNGPEKVGKEEYEASKAKCHERAAERLYELATENGGVYIKVGSPGRGGGHIQVIKSSLELA